MRDDNVEVLSIAVDREFRGAQDLLKEHKFVSGVFVAPDDDELANMYMRELMNVLAVKVPRQTWLKHLRAIVIVQQKEGVELVSPLDYLAKKQQAQKRRQRKRLQEKLQMMGASAEEEVIPTALLAEDLHSDDDMDFDLAPPTSSSSSWRRSGIHCASPCRGEAIRLQLCGWSPYFGIRPEWIGYRRSFG